MSGGPKWVNYTLAGYSDLDGLKGGRWMRDTWGVVRWVETDADKAADGITGRRRRAA